MAEAQIQAAKDTAAKSQAVQQAIDKVMPGFSPFNPPGMPAPVVAKPSPGGKQGTVSETMLPGVVQQKVYQKQQADAERGSAYKFTVDPKWQVFDKNAQGEVITYIDPNTKTIFYTPENYKWNLGWKSAEYIPNRGTFTDPEYGENIWGGNENFTYIVENKGEGLGHYVIKNTDIGVPVGPIMLTKDQYNRLIKLDGNERVDYLENLGILKAGSEAIEMGGKESIVSSKDMQKFEKAQKEYNEWERQFKIKQPEKYREYRQIVKKDGYDKAAEFLENIDRTRFASLESINASISKQIQTSTPILQKAYREGGIDKYNEVYSNAVNKLIEYRNEDGSYNILDAMIDARQANTNKEDMAIVDALGTLFPADKIEAIRLENLPALTIGTEKGSIWGESFEAAQMSLPAWLLGAAGFTKSTPIPHDDLVMLIILGAVGTGVAIKNIVSRSKESGGLSNGRIVIMGDNYATYVNPNTLTPEGGYIIDKIPYMPDTSMEQMLPARIDISKGMVLVPPVIKNEIEQFIAHQDKIFYLPTPKITPEVSDYILKYTQLDYAQKDLEKKIPKVEEIPINWNKELEKAKNQKQREKTFEEINRVVNDYISSNSASEIPKDLSKIIRELEMYESSHEEYLRKLALWREAWKSYVASMDPAPIRGRKTEDAIEAMAKIEILRILGGDKIHRANPYKIEPDEIIQISPIIRRINKEYQEQMKAGVPSIKALQSAKVELQDMLQMLALRGMKTKQSTATAQAVQTQTKTQTKTETLKETEVETELEDELARAREIARPAELTRTAELTMEFPPRIPKIPKLPKGASDKQKRDFVKKSDAAITYRRGALGQDKKSVWRTWALRKGKWERVIIIGAAPEGAKIVDGPRSAYNTIQQLGKGEFPKAELFEDTGAVDTRITIGGKKPSISFEKDWGVKKKKKDMDDIERGLLSQRERRISPRESRITQPERPISPPEKRITPREKRIS
ncbi:MAG: hypothetical protein WC312_07325 [Candidatus Omnitrophota bacterium]